MGNSSALFAMIQMKKAFLIALTLGLALTSAAYAQMDKGVKEEYKLDLSEIEKKPYHLGGYGEFRPVVNGLDHDAALYKLRFYNLDEGKTTKEYNFKLLVDGSYEQDNARLFVRLSYDVSNTYLGWKDDLTPYEAILSLKPSHSLTLDAGKKVAKWGKGYAWNPVAFIDRPKDPDEPDLALEGYWVLSADWIRSFSGPLKTLSFTPVFLPVLEGINDDFGKTGQANIAAKLYLLLYDTDIDFIVLYRRKPHDPLRGGLFPEHHLELRSSWGVCLHRRLPKEVHRLEGEYFQLDLRCRQLPPGDPLPERARDDLHPRILSKRDRVYRGARPRIFTASWTGPMISIWPPGAAPFWRRLRT